MPLSAPRSHGRHVVQFSGLYFFHDRARDTLILTSGRELDCVILTETPERYTVRRGYGVMTVPAGMVQKAVRVKPVASPMPSAATSRPASTLTHGSAGRMPVWSSVVDYIAAQTWGKSLTQIPATYIDNGVMKDVPTSPTRVEQTTKSTSTATQTTRRASRLASIESLLKDPSAKDDCVGLLSTLLPNRTDAAMARALSPEKDLITRDELTIEITHQMHQTRTGAGGSLSTMRASSKRLVPLQPRLLRNCANTGDG